MIKEKDLVFVLASSTVVSFIWIGSTIYHTIVTSTIEEPLTTQIQPIAPKFDTATLNALTRRNVTAPTYELSGRITTSADQSASEAAIPTIPPDLTPSPSEPETPLPTASTEGGNP